MGNEGTRARRFAALGLTLGLGGVYAVVAKLSLQLALVNPSASPVWPATGIALAGLLLLGARYWPGLLVGAFLVNLTTYGSVATSLGIAVGNTLEAVVGVLLVQRFARGRRAFDRPLDYLRFIVLAGVLSTAISATAGVCSLCLGGFEAWSRSGTVWATWWLGDLGGAIVVTPFLLLLFNPRARLVWTRARAIEAVLLLALLCLVGEIVFLGDVFPELSRRPLGFLFLPPLLWAAFRFGQRETAAAIVVLLAIATGGTLRGLGPYVAYGANDSLLLLQAFTATCAVTTMALAAVVRQRGRAYQALEIRARELARSNADLEQFADVATHDLQEPLRMIRIHAQQIDRKVKGRAGPEIDVHISGVERGTSRMQHLITDLLAYSRVGARPGDFRPADSGDVLREVLEDMKLAISETGARVTVGPMPRIRARRPQLGQLFSNLIGNAIKFRRSDPPEVDVRGELQGGEWVFSVRDNGIGIETSNTEQIFDVFARLHPRERYPGTGIGLAICKRIVAHHGGRIWVESQPGRGSTFYFTLPLAG